MPQKTLTLTLLSILIWNSSFKPLCALEIGESGEANVTREVVPFNLSQNNFSIDTANNFPSDELGAVPNLENTQSVQNPAQLILTPSPWKGEGRGEGKRNKTITEFTPHPNLLPKGEKELRPLKKKKPAQFLHEKKFSLASLSDLSAVYDGSILGSKMNLSVSSLDPDGNDGGFLPDLQPRAILPIRTLGNGIQTSTNDGFNQPESIFVDPKGQIYVADTFNHRIQIFDSSGKYLKTLGTSEMTSGNNGFNCPWSVFVDYKGYIYVADSSNHRIQIFHSSGKYLRTLGIGKETSGNKGFNHPGSVFVDSNGYIYVADSYNHRIQIFDQSWKLIHTLGTGEATSGAEGFHYPSGIFVDSKGYIYVADSYNHRIQIFDASLRYIRTVRIGKETSGNDGFSIPVSIFVDSKGYMYVVDTYNHRVQIFPSLGEIETTDKNRREEAEKFLSQKTEPVVPEPSNKEQPLARDRFKILWDDASRFLP